MKPLVRLVVLAALAASASAQTTPAPEPAKLPTAGPAAVANAGGIPALKVRYAKGPGGYTPDHLAGNLDVTAENIGALVAYIQPWKKGVAAPEGQELADATKSLEAESQAAADLIAEGDLLLAKGIVRNPPSQGLKRSLLYLTRPLRAYMHPTDAQRRLNIAAARGNVAGHMGALICLKLLNPPEAKYETDVEGWLAGARESLESAQKR